MFTCRGYCVNVGAGAELHLGELSSGREIREGDVLPPPIAVMRVSSQIVHSGSDIKDRVASFGYDLYDYGVDYVPPARKLTTEEAAAAKAQAAKMNVGAETAKLKFEEQAENGKDFYQYRMGMRYLNGDGVEKDPVKATEFLGKAAAQDNQDAKKALAKIAAQKSNAPADKGESR